MESLGTVVLDAVSRSERERLDEGFLLVLPVYFRILHNDYGQRAVPVLPVLVQGGVYVLSDVLIESAQIIIRVILGSGGPGLLYLGKRVCRPPGRRSGAREGYMGRSGSLGSSMGSIWATACPRTWPFGGVHVQSGVRKGRGPKDIYSTE